MAIEWDVPIQTDAYPAIISDEPYGKGSPFQQGFPEAWERMIAKHPDVVEGASGD